MHQAKAIRYLTLVLTLAIMPASMIGAAKQSRATASTKASTKKVSKAKTPTKQAAKKRKTAKRTVTAARAHQKRIAATRHNPKSRKNAVHARRYVNPWTAPDFADSTASDYVDGEDLVVRRAVVDALGPFNGSVIVVDPNTGRILSMVNQQLALKSGFQPCSTIKIVAALAGLMEGTIERETVMPLSRRYGMNLTEALARSNNPFFARIGQSLGYDRIAHYSRQFGLGEKAGLNIPGEQAGILPDRAPPEGMGMMTSFGSGITLTPLQLASLMAAIANDGTLYYLQYPKTPGEAENFVPRVKRRLDIARYIPDIKPGMLGAVEWGTARRAAWGGSEEPILGKTGTCTDSRSPTHLGWFGSYNDVGKNKLVVVVMLTGGRAVSGPVASGVAGQVYRNLYKVNYFEQERPISPVALVSTACCESVETN
jgi:penicillin-binding protein 2